MAYASNGPIWQLVEPTITDPDEIAAIGAVEVVEDNFPPPDGWVSVGSALIDIDGVPHRQWTNIAFSLDDARSNKLSDLDALFQGTVAAGFPCEFDGVAETLQVRGADDKINWLTLKDAAKDAVAAGLGDDPVALPIRCTSNREHSLSNNATITLLNDLRAWLAGLMELDWSYKDAINAATTEGELAAVDVTQNWP